MQGPGSQSRIIYIDGAFDLFHAGHVEVHSHLIFFFYSNEKKNLFHFLVNLLLFIFCIHRYYGLLGPWEISY